MEQNNTQPLVAIKCFVYNHEPYLRDCLEGFVMQQTEFPFVAIVHDDASTDKSADIIREYAANYPDIIKPIYETENQYSKSDGSLGRIMNAAVDATGAKYIAMCEGDDYWTDPRKLQKQVDFLETHPDYSMVCGRYVRYWQNYGKYDINDNFSFLFPHNEPIADFTLEVFPWIPQVLTVMYRCTLVETLNHTFYRKLKYHYDVPWLYAVMRCAKIAILNEVMGIYRKHDGGIYSGLTGCKNAQKMVDTYCDIYRNDPTEQIRELLEYSLWQYGYQYIKYENKLNISTVISTYKLYRDISTSNKRYKYCLRLVRAYTLRIIKQPYLHPQSIVPKLSDLKDTI